MVAPLLFLLALGKPSDDKLLADLRQVDGVKELSDGLLYKVITRGEGKTHPQVSTRCSVHYAGKILADFVEGNEKEFDSSYSRGKPSQFAPNQVIKAWTMMLQSMVEGDKVEIYLPANLGYGDRGSGSGKIKKDEALMFTIELIQILGSTVDKSSEL